MVHYSAIYVRCATIRVRFTKAAKNTVTTARMTSLIQNAPQDESLYGAARLDIRSLVFHKITPKYGEVDAAGIHRIYGVPLRLCIDWWEECV